MAWQATLPAPLQPALQAVHERIYLACNNLGYGDALKVSVRLNTFATTLKIRTFGDAPKMIVVVATSVTDRFFRRGWLRVFFGVRAALKAWAAPGRPHTKRARPKYR